jgi:5-hydroxyisourate hydrolase
MSAITTHILDTSLGRPAAGVEVVLDFFSSDSWVEVGQGTTDGDGRVKSLLADDVALAVGTYRLTFETKSYFDARNIQSFYPHVTISFVVDDANQHYHVPLLLNPFGYSTYRGS